MKYDVIVIGAGISGLTAAALLAKRGVHTAVIDKGYCPGGSCGIFKRDGIIYDNGAAMLFGFGEKGFNAHRFVFNCLEEPIDVIKHDLLYCLNFKDHRIRFYDDIDRFTEELGEVFPSEKENIRRFYKDLGTMYRHIMVENPSYTTPDETSPREAVKSFAKHPLSYIKFLSLLNKSAESLLKKYFTDPEIFKFYDKLTSTYCYTTVKESPAVLAAVMFVDNHVGGSYYPAGSTLFLPGKLEKVIEDHGGEMLPGKEAVQILFDKGKPAGAVLSTGEIMYADNLIYAGTVWNLYGRLIAPENLKSGRIGWAARQVPTYPSVVLYAHVDRKVIPEDTEPVSMLVGNPDRIDEGEVTVYISSIDDRTLCGEDSHVVMAIGPTFENWNFDSPADYARKKQKEKARLLDILEKRFPGFTEGVRSAVLATPRTIERYTGKNGGAVAGPKQMLGQHMFHRMHTRSEWDTLFCCGESTVMGTGTPTVTTSGISAANAVLKKLGKAPYVYKAGRTNYVRIVDKPFTPADLYSGYPEETRAVMRKASACQYCEHPGCSKDISLDIRGIMRRVTVGNFAGAKKLADKYLQDTGQQEFCLSACEEGCVQKAKTGKSVEIQTVVDWAARRQGGGYGG